MNIKPPLHVITDFIFLKYRQTYLDFDLEVFHNAKKKRFKLMMGLTHLCLKFLVCTTRTQSLFVV